VSLVDAVLASGALPGIFALTEVDGRRYADGGVHSLYNADLAALRLAWPQRSLSS
jgi:NTE family protein